MRRRQPSQSMAAWQRVYAAARRPWESDAQTVVAERLEGIPRGDSDPTRVTLFSHGGSEDHNSLTSSVRVHLKRI